MVITAIFAISFCFVFYSFGFLTLLFVSLRHPHILAIVVDIIFSLLSLRYAVKNRTPMERNSVEHANDHNILPHDRNERALRFV